jgi:hypothetical protein
MTTFNDKELDLGVGLCDVGYFYQTGVAADTETVTINGRVYEFDTDSSTTGDVDVDINADQTADASITALVAAVNGDGSRTVDAVAMAGNADTNAGAMLNSISKGANITLATDVTNGVVSAAALTGTAVTTSLRLSEFSYTVTAADVTQLATTGGNSICIAGFPVTSEPTLVSVLVKSATGGWVVPVLTVLFAFRQTNSNFYVLEVDDSAATLTATDVITGIASV